MTEEERMAEAIADRRHFIFFDGSGHERVVVERHRRPPAREEGAELAPWSTWKPKPAAAATTSTSNWQGRP
ncbi:hypothetical protein QJS66_23520 (plasmid) [Kocuria rhizophila]|nr:hypothetical protein QJS66_23520 [Kocuria rhizophila]